VKRRKALQTIGWSLSGGALLPSIISSCTPKDPGPEIVYSGSVAVIGAGAAGLYVGDILRSKGIKVAIYEARDQVGGRVRSLRNQSLDQYPLTPQMSSDFPIELGAQTIIGTDSIFGKIYQVYGLRTTEFAPPTNNYVLDDIATLKPAARSEVGWGSDPDFNAAKNFRANLRSHAGSSDTVQQSVANAGINARAFGMLNGQIGNAYGSDNDTAGIGELGEEETLRTTDGKILALTANPMQDALISRFSTVQSLVKLNTPIKSIDYGSDPISLTAKDGTVFTANKVIVTVPVSILKNGGLTFSPGLPGSFTGSLSKIEMGASIRAVLEFKKNFWGDSVGYILGSSNVPEYLSVGMSRSQFNATLSVTVNGAKAVQYSALGDAMIDAILADVDLLYAGQGTQFIRQDINTGKGIFVIQDWTKMDYILGGASYPLPGATNNDRKAIGQSVSGKLFFAGEATDITGQAGMVNGALASAERAAQEIIEAIKSGA
jgi:monoamine oxidase